MMGVIAALLLVTAVLLAAETLCSGAAWSGLAHDPTWTLPVAIVAGLLVGAISSLLGVAGGEFIIPILIFIFGADIRTAGTASVLISIPVVLTGVARHWLTGPLPFAIAAGLSGAAHGHRLGDRRDGRRLFAAWAPTDALRVVLAAILAISAAKLWAKGH